MIDLDKLDAFARALATASPAVLLALIVLIIGWLYRKDSLAHAAELARQRDVMKEAHARRDQRENMLIDVMRQNADLYTKAVHAHASSCAEQAQAIQALGDGFERLSETVREGHERQADALRELARETREQRRR